MKEKRFLTEIDIIRSIACLCVVLLHAIKLIVGSEYEGTGLIDQTLLTIAGLLSFGTAAFVVISQLILSYSYPNLLPEKFYKTRIKYLLLPFVFIGIFYAVIFNISNPSKIPKEAIFNVMGNYHGWFVLVIFQLYLLHGVIVKLSKRFSAKVILFASLLINVFYLGIFNFFEPPKDSVFLNYFWESGFMKLFLGWVFYFSIAYYIGKQYKESLKFIEKNIKWLYLSLPIIVFVIIYNNIYFDFGYGSRRIDMIFFTVSLVLIMLFKFNSVKKTPVLLGIISRYSFGIYLLHYFYLIFFWKVIRVIGLDLGYLNILILFLSSIVGSIFTIYMGNKIPYGEFVVSRVRIRLTNKQKPTME